MSDPKELDALVPGEAKRQREALRRKIDRGGPYIDFSCSRFSCSSAIYLFPTLVISGLQPGMVEKFAAARTPSEKPIPWIHVQIVVWLMEFGLWYVSVSLGLSS